jgi:mannonate dehydratase
MRFAIHAGAAYSSESLRFAKQIGCTDAIGGGPPAPSIGIESPWHEVWKVEDLVKMKRQTEAHGLRLEVFEDCPPINKIMLGYEGREEQLENFCKSVENVGEAGIHTINASSACWIDEFGVWGRVAGTGTLPGRGGARTRAFDYEEIKKLPLTEYGELTEERTWENLTYLVKGVVPSLESSGVRLAFHPCDPPISPTQGFARPLRSTETFDRLLDIVPTTDTIGLNFCQGCFSEMGEDILTAIHHFGSRGKLFFGHFRDVRGAVPKFQEVLHDDGQTDMFEAMEAYYDVNFEGPMRPDHGVGLEGDAGWKMAKVFAIGYMKGLAESVEKTR